MVKESVEVQCEVARISHEDKNKALASSITA